MLWLELHEMDKELPAKRNIVQNPEKYCKNKHFYKMKTINRYIYTSKKSYIGFIIPNSPIVDTTKFCHVEKVLVVHNDLVII